jgi:hypothetical protein
VQAASARDTCISIAHPTPTPSATTKRPLNKNFRTMYSSNDSANPFLPGSRFEEDATRHGVFRL